MQRTLPGCRTTASAACSRSTPAAGRQRPPPTPTPTPIRADEGSRKSIFKSALRKSPVAPDVDLDLLSKARRTPLLPPRPHSMLPYRCQSAMHQTRAGRTHWPPAPQGPTRASPATRLVSPAPGLCPAGHPGLLRRRHHRDLPARRQVRHPRVHREGGARAQAPAGCPQPARRPPWALARPRGAGCQQPTAPAGCGQHAAPPPRWPRPAPQDIERNRRKQENPDLMDEDDTDPGEVGLRMQRQPCCGLHLLQAVRRGQPPAALRPVPHSQPSARALSRPCFSTSHLSAPSAYGD